MRRSGRLAIGIALAALGLASPVAAEEPRHFIVGRAIVLDNVQQPPDAPLLEVPCKSDIPNTECLPWLFWTQIKIRVVQLYAGKLEDRSLVAWIALHADWLLRKEGRPFLELPRIYFVGRMVKGEFNIVGWDFTDRGFCLVSEKDARDIGLEAQMAQLRRDHPCEGGG